MSSNSTSPQQRHRALPQGSPSLRSPYTLIVFSNRGQGSNSVCVFVILSVHLCLQSCSLFGWQSYIVKVVHLIRWCRWEFLSLHTYCLYLVACICQQPEVDGLITFYLLLASLYPGSISSLRKEVGYISILWNGDVLMPNHLIYRLFMSSFLNLMNQSA